MDKVSVSNGEQMLPFFMTMLEPHLVRNFTGEIIKPRSTDELGENQMTSAYNNPGQVLQLGTPRR